LFITALTKILVLEYKEVSRETFKLIPGRRILLRSRQRRKEEEEEPSRGSKNSPIDLSRIDSP